MNSQYGQNYGWVIHANGSTEIDKMIHVTQVVANCPCLY